MTPRAMGHRIRYIPEKGTVEVTLRTVQGRMLLRPCPCLDQRILAVLGRAQRLYPVRIHAFTIMSNHVHFELSVDDAKQLADFLRHVDKNVADAVRAVTGWTGPVWHKRPNIAVIVDDEQALARLRYICANGVKEGLVAHPLEWPGVSSARALAEQTAIKTYWIDAAGRRAAKRAGRSPHDIEFAEENDLVLTPLPCLADKTVEQRIEFFQRMFDDIAHEAATARAGKPVLGRKSILKANRRRPHPIDLSPGPIVHASTKAAREAFLEERDEFIAAHRATRWRLRAAGRAAPYPPGSFPPALPFVPWRAVTTTG